MSRNNSERLGVPATPDAAEDASAASQAAAPASLSYVTPTEFVELPSSGKLYPPDHPLHNQETVEIRYMTAKDEDILTSKALLRKGLAIDRMLENLIINSNVQVRDLLVGDKNALVLAARASGYGPTYDTKVTCPSCDAVVEYSFDISLCSSKPGKALSGQDEQISVTNNGTFLTTLPQTKYDLEYRILNGHDEAYLVEAANKKAKLKLPDAAATDLLKRVVVSVNGVTNRVEVNNFVENMPAIF